MSLLGVVAVDLGAGFADLFCDQELLLAFDDGLNRGVLVATPCKTGLRSPLWSPSRTSRPDYEWRA